MKEAMAADMPDVSVVVPLYNEAATVLELVERTTACLQARGERFEIVVVDDGSTDRTAALLSAVAATNSAMRVLTLSRNFGQSAALCCGIFAARGRVVVTMDGDLQNPPEEIPRLLDALQPGVDLVSGCRAVRHERAWRLLGSRAVHWIARGLIGGDLQDFGGQFKAYRRDVIAATRTAWVPGRPFFALAVWLGFRVVEIHVRHDPRRIGASRYGLASLLRLNLEVIAGFTTVPLALLAVLSIVTGTGGTIGLLWCLWTEQTLTLVAALSLLLIGLGGVFLAAATLAVYLAQVHRTVASLPTGYVLRPDSDE